MLEKAKKLMSFYSKSGTLNYDSLYLLESEKDVERLAYQIILRNKHTSEIKELIEKLIDEKSKDNEIDKKEMAVIMDELCVRYYYGDEIKKDYEEAVKGWEIQVKKLYNSNNLKLSLNNFGNFAEFSITAEDDAQEIAKNVKADYLNTYCFESNDVIQSFIIELFEMTEIESTAIKKCKNCGKFFVPDNRVDELYCNSIYENNKTCKEVGPFRTKQKLMQENDDLRVYRNVYQKLLLRTRRNPTNTQYEEDFNNFKEENNELKKKVENGEIPQAKYVKWLEEQ